MRILKVPILIILSITFASVQGFDLMNSPESISVNQYSPKKELNAFGQPVKVIFPNGSEICFFYDHIGRVKRCIMPDRSEFSYIYNRNRLMIKTFGSRTIKYEYDEFERLTKKTILQEDKVLIETRRYDQNGNLLTISENGKNAINFLYDRFGKRILETGPTGTIKYEYDEFGRLETRELEIKGGQKFQTNYSYGYSNYQICIINSPAGNFYFNWSRATKKLHQIEYEYSDNNICKLYAVKTSFNLNKGIYAKSFARKGAQPLEILQRCYNKSGQLIRNKLFDFIWNYNYDQYGRILSASGIKDKKFDFSYDESGNCVKYGDENFTYNDMWQISQPGYKYDSWGNLIESPTVRYEYDLKNRLIMFRKDGLTISYDYDPMNQLIARTIINSSGEQSKTNFLMSDMIEYARITDGTATCHTFTPNIAEKIHKSLLDPLMLASSSSDGQNTYYISDFDGSVVAAFSPSENGNITKIISYSPYGRIVSNSGDKENLIYGFKMMLNIGKGLYFNNGRIYSTELRSYLTRTPNIFFTESPYSFERYNPISWKLKYDDNGFDADIKMYKKFEQELSDLEEVPADR